MDMAYQKAAPPSHEEIREARKAAGLSQTAAAALVHPTCRVWQQWESAPEIKSHQKMHPAFWELFCIKVKKLKK
jgi:DNA-binding transcriptional regulator YiaG